MVFKEFSIYFKGLQPIIFTTFVFQFCWSNHYSTSFEGNIQHFSELSQHFSRLNRQPFSWLGHHFSWSNHHFAWFNHNCSLLTTIFLVKLPFSLVKNYHSTICHGGFRHFWWFNASLPDLCCWHLQMGHVTLGHPAHSAERCTRKPQPGQGSEERSLRS